MVKEEQAQRWEDPKRGPQWVQQALERHEAVRSHLEPALAGATLPDRVALRLLEMAPELVVRELVDREMLSRFVVLASQSTLTGRFLARRPEVLGREEALRAELGASLQDWIAAAEREDEVPVTEVMEALRLRRRLGMFAVIEGEATGSLDILQSAALVTQLAEEAIEDATALAVAAHGVRDVGFFVLGMGKLGAGELNLSSDIDLILGMRDAVAPEVESNVVTAARLLTRLLDEATALGPVFRVDLRLRPFGTQGPLVLPADAMRAYYEAHGRTWERGAWIKARCVGGDHEVANALITSLQPFVYRRSLDAAAIEGVAEMKRSVEVAQRRASSEPGPGWDVKHGRGGIREVEFFAQAFQLVYGGRQEALRVRATPEVLRHLNELGLIRAEDRRALEEAYSWFRLVEHRVQAEEERQTHRLPEKEAYACLAWKLGLAGADALTARLVHHTNEVGLRFARLLQREDPVTPAQLLLQRIMESDEASPEILEDLQAIGVRRSRGVFRDLRRLAAPPNAVVGPHAPRATRRPAEGLVTDAMASLEPERALDRMWRVLSERHAREVILPIVRAAPQASQVLATVLAADEELGLMMSREPRLLETLLANAAAPVLGADALRARWLPLLDNPDRSPRALERRLVALRRGRVLETLRILLGVWSGRLTLEAAFAGLADLACVLVDLTGREAMAQGGDGAPRMAAVGFGKLGAGELGLASDVDLVFVCRGGPESLEAASGVARRWVSYLSTPMAYGRCYDVDLRLRPDGGQGTVVTTEAGFASYYKDRAAPWEFIALTRARAVGGSPRLGKDVDRAIRSAIRGASPDAAYGAWLDVRQRRLDEESEQLGWHVKSGPGGLMDLEQGLGVLLLRHATERRAARSTLAQIAALEAAGVLRYAQARLLRRTWRDLRRLELVSKGAAPRSGRWAVGSPEAERWLPWWLALGGEEGTDMDAIVERATTPVHELLASLSDRDV